MIWGHPYFWKHPYDVKMMKAIEASPVVNFIEMTPFFMFVFFDSKKSYGNPQRLVDRNMLKSISDHDDIKAIGSEIAAGMPFWCTTRMQVPVLQDLIALSLINKDGSNSIQKTKQVYTLKMDGWKMTFLVGKPIWVSTQK